MPVLRFSALICAPLLLSTLAPAGAEIFEGFPDAVICKYQGAARDFGGDAVFYMDSRQENGVVIYKVFGRVPVVLRVGPDGVIDAGKLRDCHGKSVQQLRKAGRAFDLRKLPSGP